MPKTTTKPPTPAAPLDVAEVHARLDALPLERLEVSRAGLPRSERLARLDQRLARAEAELDAWAQRSAGMFGHPDMKPSDALPEQPAGVREAVDFIAWAPRFQRAIEAHAPDDGLTVEERAARLASLDGEATALHVQLEADARRREGEGEDPDRRGDAPPNIVLALDLGQLEGDVPPDLGRFRALQRRARTLRAGYERLEGDAREQRKRLVRAREAAAERDEPRARPPRSLRTGSSRPTAVTLMPHANPEPADAAADELVGLEIELAELVAQRDQAGARSQAAAALVAACQAFLESRGVWTGAGSKARNLLSTSYA